MPDVNHFPIEAIIILYSLYHFNLSVHQFFMLQSNDRIYVNIPKRCVDITKPFKIAIVNPIYQYSTINNKENYSKFNTYYV